MTARPEDTSFEVAEVTDERSPLALSALRMFERAFAPRDRQPIAELRSEIEEKRLGLLITTEYHMLAAVDERGGVAGAISGVYLQGVNAGFVYYLTVEEAHRGQRVGRRLRSRLVELFGADSVNAGHEGLAWVLGEVRVDNPWMRGLVRRRGAIPFDLRYYHPGMEMNDARRYVLYRQPVADTRPALPANEVTRILYQIYRRAYRAGYPLLRPTFRAMIAELQEKGEIGLHPDFEVDPV